MEEQIKDKAERYRRLYNDPTFKEVIEIVKERQVDVFKDFSSDTISIESARNVILALHELESVFKYVFDEEAIFDSKQN
jgi:hypothetical protein